MQQSGECLSGAARPGLFGTRILPAIVMSKDQAASSSVDTPDFLRAELASLRRLSMRELGSITDIEESIAIVADKLSKIAPARLVHQVTIPD